jgi:hypothetical protein
VTTRAHHIDRLVATVATVRDAELEGTARSPEGRALLVRLVDEPYGALTPRPARRHRRPLVAGVAGLAAALAAATVVGALVSRGTGTASAATVLRHAATAAGGQQPLVPGPGQYVYTKSVDAYLDTVGDGPHPYSALVAHTREIWLGPSGGRLHETSGAPQFLSERDRAAWIAAGRPALDGPVSDTEIDPSQPVDLPSDPDALWERLRRDAAGHGSGLYTEMFTLVGDSLRETAITPAQRAALYVVAARIPGVQLLGDVTDSAGRPGVAVAMDNDVNRDRSTLVLDPKTGALLAEEDVVLAGNAMGYPAGTRIGSATYLVQGIVDSDTARPAR